MKIMTKEDFPHVFTDNRGRRILNKIDHLCGVQEKNVKNFIKIPFSLLGEERIFR